MAFWNKIQEFQKAIAISLIPFELCSQSIRCEMLRMTYTYLKIKKINVTFDWNNMRKKEEEQMQIEHANELNTHTHNNNKISNFYKRYQKKKTRKWKFKKMHRINGNEYISIKVKKERLCPRKCIISLRTFEFRKDLGYIIRWCILKNK